LTCETMSNEGMPQRKRAAGKEKRIYQSLEFKLKLVPQDAS
jgi:hypothetical protein